MAWLMLKSKTLCLIVVEPSSAAVLTICDIAETSSALQAATASRLIFMMLGGLEAMVYGF
jgi:hypothetical protein